MPSLRSARRETKRPPRAETGRAEREEFVAVGAHAGPEADGLHGPLLADNPSRVLELGGRQLLQEPGVVPALTAGLHGAYAGPPTGKHHARATR